MVDRMGNVQHVHFVGIGGVGMSGIAEVLLNLGYSVSGSDQRLGPATERLAGFGARIEEGHAEAHLGAAEVVVVSSAIDLSNPEVSAALKARIPVIPRAQMLAELMRFKHGIAISGTHGKTTTTSLAASVLAEAGLDPTYIIGGKLNQVDANAKLGDGRYLVAEADESDASFLVLKPMTAIVTNIDADHMATYGGDFERLKQTFVQFLQNLPFYGLVIANADDPVVMDILPTVGRTAITFGLNEGADYRAVEITPEGLVTRFVVIRPDASRLAVTLPMPGVHNVQNALAVIALADALNIQDLATCRALSAFQGVGRRFQLAGHVEVKGGAVPVIDDYGHHPKELEVTFAAVRAAYPGCRMISVFQPHRFSRTQDLFDEFVSVLTTADALILLPVYAAGEKPLVGAESKDLAKVIRQMGQCQPVVEKDFEHVIVRLQAILQPNDVLLIQGAGSVGRLPQLVLSAMGGGHAVES